MKHFLLLIILSLSATAIAEPLAIRHVHHKPSYIEQAEKGGLIIKYSLSSKARVQVSLYDGRDLLVRRIAGEDFEGPGESSVVWDARDEAGRFVVPGAYHYTVTATDKDGNKVEYDLSDQTGGREQPVKGLRWDSEKGQLSYRLARAGRVQIRFGLDDNGPMLGTSIDWASRRAGVHVVTWDAVEAFSSMPADFKERLEFNAQSYTLSDNTILVGPEVVRATLIPSLPWGKSKRTAKSIPKKRMFDFRQQPIEKRCDFKVTLRLPNNEKQPIEGTPIVQGIVPVRIDMDQEDRQWALATRFEPVFYVDGQFAYESEAGMLPMTWRWDTNSLDKGKHTVTVNVRGYEGNFGVATETVIVR